MEAEFVVLKQLVELNQLGVPGLRSLEMRTMDVENEGGHDEMPSVRKGKERLVEDTNGKK
jgi:hypothetical protein